MRRYSRFLTGLIAATHTPFHPDGSLNLNAIEHQANRLKEQGLTGAFVCGTTGEGLSLTAEERRQVATRWGEVIRGSSLKLIVHVGHTSLREAQGLAAHAQSIGAHGTAAMAPCYFKPETQDALVTFCAGVASSAPALPFYFYHFPGLSGVGLSPVDFLEQAQAKIENLAGLKFTNTDMMALQGCLQLDNGAFNVLFGCDEMLLAALGLGAESAVGSTFNFAAPVYQKLMGAYTRGDMAAARGLQFKSVQMVEILRPFGALAAGKALMEMVGVDCGPVRSPLVPLSREQKQVLFKKVETLGIVG